MKCVRESSATYEGQRPKVQNIGLPVNHYGLNKFASRSEIYDLILSQLVEMIITSPLSGKYYYIVPLETTEIYTERAKLSTELEEKLQIRHDNASIPYIIAFIRLGDVDKFQLALDYAEKHRNQYNPILWIDTTDQKAVRSSFKRCTRKLRLLEDNVEDGGSVLKDIEIYTILG
jgi:hypothetical protein